MSKEPHGKLDPHVAIRDPGSLPKLVRWSMYDFIMRETGGSDPTPDDFIKAFNIITWSLITAGTTRSNHDATPRPKVGKLRKVLRTGRKKSVTKKTAGAVRDGSEARIKPHPQDETRVVLTKIGETVERSKLKRPEPSPSGRQPRARSRQKLARRPWVPFEMKARAIAGWASSIYDDDKERYEMTYQEAKRRG